MKRDCVDISKFKKVMFVFNPKAGKQFLGDKMPRLNEVRKLIKQLLAKDVLVDAEIRSFEEIGGIAQRACDENFDWVIVAGGDGTLRAITEMFVGQKKIPYMSIFPAGTVNLVAKELQMTSEPQKWIRRIKKGIATPVWLGSANDRVFLTVAGIGVDSMVVDNVSEKEKKLLNKFAYAWQGAEMIKRELLWTDWQYKFQVMIDNDGLWRDASSVIVAKSRYYAGRFSLVDGASLSSPKLHVCMFTGNKRADFLRYTALLATDLLGLDKSVHMIEAQTVEIKSNVANFAAELDGDSLVTSPLKISLLEEPVYFIS